MFVVHFYPVVFHPVFDPCTRRAFLVVVSDLPLEGPVEFSPEEGQYILGAKAQGGVPEQFLIQRPEGKPVFKHNVGGVFSLLYDPTIPHGLEQI